MKLIVETQPLSVVPNLHYSWDSIIGILGARISAPGTDTAPSTSGIVSITTPDSAFMHFELTGGLLRAFEIALWPLYCEVPLPDATEECSAVSLRSGSRPIRNGSLIGFSLPIEARGDPETLVLSLRFRSSVVQRVVRAADRFYVGVDRAGCLASIWLSNVPGFGVPFSCGGVVTTEKGTDNGEITSSEIFASNSYSAPTRHFRDSPRTFGPDIDQPAGRHGL
jgi:hypothetical protein